MRTFEECPLKKLFVADNGASIINNMSTLALFGILTKHLSDKLTHVQRNISGLIAGNDHV